MQGRWIKGGMVYVGSDILSVGGYNTEPCLVDPALPVDWERPGWDGTALDLRPSYSGVDERARAGYLAWLAGGRQEASARIEYVFLFFYGLERRLFFDIGSELDHPDVPLIVTEILRLLTIYGVNHNFARYAGSLLVLLESLLLLRGDVEPVVLRPEPDARGDLLQLLIYIGMCVANGRPIPAEWALAYLLIHPDTKLRTAAERCQSEFEDLFLARYPARHPGGIKTSQPAPNLCLRYQAASHGFRGLLFRHPSDPALAGGFELGHGTDISIKLDGIPDITAIPSLIKDLWALAEECTDQLDAYSRFIGKDRVGAESAAAISLLPDVLLASRGGPILDELRKWLSEKLDGERTAVIRLDDLVRRWSPDRTAKLTRRDASSLASLLGQLGIGMEPDVRFGAGTPKPGSSSVLFRLPDGAAGTPSPAYTRALPLIHLAAVVAGADGTISPDQRRFVGDHLEKTYGLDEADRRRVGSHMKFLTTGRLGMYGMKRRMERFSDEDRAGAGRFLIALATADGVVSGSEVRALEKVFGYLGLDEADVYRRLHGLDNGDPEPVTVRRSQPGARWEIPDAEGPAANRPAVTLDLAKVQDRLADTARVSDLLIGIFTDDDPPPETERPTTGPEPESIIEGLDSPHSQLLAALAARSEWERRAAEELAESFGLPFLDGALDVINENALDTCGEPVVEGDDPVVLNTYAVEELL